MVSFEKNTKFLKKAIKVPEARIRSKIIDGCGIRQYPPLRNLHCDYTHIA